jgi:hypothetical protein
VIGKLHGIAMDGGGDRFCFFAGPMGHPFCLDQM